MKKRIGMSAVVIFMGVLLFLGCLTESNQANNAVENKEKMENEDSRESFSYVGMWSVVRGGLDGGQEMRWDEQTDGYMQFLLENSGKVTFISYGMEGEDGETIAGIWSEVENGISIICDDGESLDLQKDGNELRLYIEDGKYFVLEKIR